MKQIGTPISSTFQGIGCITVFATLSCGLALKLIMIRIYGLA